MLTSPELGTPAAAGLGTPVNNASVLDLAGFQSNPNPPPPNTPPNTPWDGGCWDIIFTDDLPASRPDPITGQLWYGGNFYGLIPLSQAAFGATTDPVIYPLPQAPDVSTASLTPANLIQSTYFLGDKTKTPGPFPASYFLTIGNVSPTQDTGKSETNAFTPSLTLATAPVNYDPLSGTPTTTLPLGVLPQPTTGPAPTYPKSIPAPTMGSGTGSFYWICLRRPANPFAGVSATNPMIVVDCMRFPYIESGGQGAGTNVTKVGTNYMYSYQRLQPFRGGHAVPMPGVAGTLDPRYGYTEQMAVATTTVSPPPPLAGGATDYGQYGTSNISSNPIYHTLGFPNDGTLNPGAAVPSVVAPYLNEPWDYFPFNDRDFTSVAELLMVPGCPPGLFTKQFAEFAPSATNVTSIFGMVTPLSTPQLTPLPAAGQTASNPFSTPVLVSGSFNPLIPHTFPYLVDKFFYSAPLIAAEPSLFGDPTGDGWFKMFEFFEVPSQMIGAIGPVAQGATSTGCARTPSRG